MSMRNLAPFNSPISDLDSVFGAAEQTAASTKTALKSFMLGPLRVTRKYNACGGNIGSGPERQDGAGNRRFTGNRSGHGYRSGAQRRVARGDSLRKLSGGRRADAGAGGRRRRPSGIAAWRSLDVPGHRRF